MKRKRTYLICGILCMAACILCVVWAVSYRTGGGAEEQTQAALNVTPAASPSASEAILEATPEPTETYKSPIDFEQLQEGNPDIYAWLEIPAIGLSYPVLQREGDDSYYLRRDSAGNSYIGGCLFTEGTYNSLDFTDPVTVIYGHRMGDGSMFGSLQTTYSVEETFQAASEIVVYLPDRELHYQVFAAVPYDNRHILYNYDFENSRMSNAFFDSVLSIRAIGAQFGEDTEVGTEDRVLILSTCLQGDNTRRYLVLAKLYESTPV